MLPFHNKAEEVASTVVIYNNIGIGFGAQRSILIFKLKIEMNIFSLFFFFFRLVVRSGCVVNKID